MKAERFGQTAAPNWPSFFGFGAVTGVLPTEQKGYLVDPCLSSVEILPPPILREDFVTASEFRPQS